MIAGDFDLMNRAYSQYLKFAYIDQVLANFSLGGVSETNAKLCDLESRIILDKYFALDLFKQALQSMIGEEIHQVSIFGAGRWGERMAHILQRLNISVNYFVDNSSAKWGKKMNEIMVVSPK